MDVEASRAIRQAEVGASRTMIARTEQCFGIKPDWLAADTAYGSAPNLDWLVTDKAIAPHIPVIDKSKREDGTLSRDDFTYDTGRDFYVCPWGADLSDARPHPRQSYALVSGQRERLPPLPLEGNVLPEDAATQSHAQHL